MKLASLVLRILAAITLSPALHAQTDTYILNGSATQNSCNCYTLTQAINNQHGSVWNANKIDLNNPFDFIFNVYLGCQDANGADGVVFILQPISTSIGSVGGGIGFQGIVPSVGISIDTWQNIDLNDPAYDHISIQLNGVVSHSASDPGPPVRASAINDNIEDCQWHTFRISWNPSTKLLSTYFDNQFREEANIDLIATVFNNDPMVYWGFSSATGGANNLQQFCTALNPDFVVSTGGNNNCVGSTTSFTNLSQSFAPITSFFWDFDDGTTSTLPSPPAHLFAAAGSYEIKLAITGLDGCFSDTLKKIVTVGDYPVADFNVYDTCAGIPPRMEDRSQLNFGNIAEWQWTLDGSPVSFSQYPSLAGLLSGVYNLQLIVKSNYGCQSAPVTKQFMEKRVPTIESTVAHGCIGLPVTCVGRQMDNASWISTWNWQFGDGQSAAGQNTSHIYSSTGNYTVELTAIADNGCSSNTATVSIPVSEVIADAGKDTTILMNTPFQLKGSGGVNYSWSPANHLSDPGIPNPLTTLLDDITYTLTVSNADGCVGKDDIHITVFKGSSVFVPSAFTPNGDGLNDLLRPRYNGIKTLDYFKVFNRWGQEVFFTKNISEGWNGMINGSRQGTGVYVWMLSATDFVGKVYQLQGTSTIIR